jgi:hypothetical protein
MKAAASFAKSERISVCNSAARHLHRRGGADYDRDGWLDVYFCLYVYYQGTDQYKYPSPYYDAENGPPNFMMRNNRDGTFRDVTAETGLNQNNTRYSFCCGWTTSTAMAGPIFTWSMISAARIFTATMATEPLPTSPAGGS